ncbi:MIF4G domain-containing protein-like [Dermacentor andersoni]|uniref:MIF4G domain-containing protein-like n=1 Tax=Dermacentor andersoni TaxID=34620 RepID=UPI002416B3BF|nr:MIF4G domain-containing protein-like [Dermacentor andersoni]
MAEWTSEVKSSKAVSTLPSPSIGQEAAADSGPICPKAVAWSERQPGIYREIIQKAIHDPASVRGIQWMELARAFCGSVIESNENAGTVATLCIFFSQVDKTRAFLCALIKTTREWFDRRAELLQAPNGYPRRWTAYVFLVTELFVGLKRQRAHVSTIALLALLLLQSCLVILRTPMTGSSTEMECLRWVLTVAGRDVQSTNAWLMVTLIRRMRNAFAQSDASTMARHTLLELIELHASGWQLNAAQLQYYCPHARLHCSEAGDNSAAVAAGPHFGNANASCVGVRATQRAV